MGEGSKKKKKKERKKEKNDKDRPTVYLKFLLSACVIISARNERGWTKETSRTTPLCYCRATDVINN